jgi:hypothetical protein
MLTRVDPNDPNWLDKTQFAEKLLAEHQARVITEYKNTFMTDAILLRDEMVFRLSKRLPRDLKSLDYISVNSLTIGLIADELENLVRQFDN